VCHSFGAAIDINVKYSAYWRWSKREISFIRIKEFPQFGHFLLQQFLEKTIGHFIWGVGLNWGYFHFIEPLNWHACGIIRFPWKPFFKKVGTQLG